MTRTSWLLPSLPLLVGLLLLAACGGGGSGGTDPTTITATPPPGGGSPPPALPPSDAVEPTAGPLAEGRYAHTATLLLSGHVLVAGGTVSGTTLTDVAELYDPATRSFRTLTPRLRAARSNHTATLLQDGRVLLAGGWSTPAAGSLQAQDRAEVFDPASGLFIEVGPMRQARVDHAAALLPDGRVLITGGSVRNGSFLADLLSAELFDPESGTFSAHPTGMVHTHSTHACLQVGPTRFLVAGGSDADLRPEVYDAATGTFSALAAAVGDAPRFNAAAATFATGGLVLAGGDERGTVVHVLAPGTLARSTGSPLTRPRHYATATRISDAQVLVVGGVDFGAGGTFHSGADLIVEGGLTGALTYATDVRFPTPLAAHTATLLADGRVLYCGGLVGDDAQSGRTEAYLLRP